MCLWMEPDHGWSRVEGKENDKSIKIEVVENKRDEMMVLKIGFDV